MRKLEVNAVTRSEYAPTVCNLIRSPVGHTSGAGRSALPLRAGRTEPTDNGDPRSVNRRIVLTVALVAAVLSGCATTIAGTPQAAGTEAGYGEGPTIPEAPADWAVSALDPCALLQGTPVAAKAPPFASKPHNCAVDYTMADGKPDRLVVRVGIAFDTNDRARAAPTTLGGLLAFQSRDTKGETYRPPVCLIDIPISATRSIQVDTVSLGGDVNAACAAARAAGEPVAAKLASPASLARTTPPTGLPSWHACDLLEKALGYKPDRGGLGSANADECRATEPGGERGKDAEVEIETESGPAEPEKPGRGDTAISLPLGPAIQKPYGTTMCKVVAVVAQIPGAPKETATHVMTVTARKSADLCADAVTAATKIQTTIQSTPASIPQAPTKLGFAPNEPSDTMPVACGLYGNTTADTCREPRPVTLPKGAAEIMRVGSFGPIAPDVNCAMVREAAKPVIGEVQVAASGEAGCIAMSDDFQVDLGLYNKSPAQEYCKDKTLRGAEVQVAGRSGVVCVPGGTTYQLILPAIGTTAADVGVVLVDGKLNNKRGDRTIDRPDNADRVRELTTKIAENVIKQYLS